MPVVDAYISVHTSNPIRIKRKFPLNIKIHSDTLSIFILWPMERSIEEKMIECRYGICARVVGE